MSFGMEQNELDNDDADEDNGFDKLRSKLQSIKQRKSKATW